MYRSCDERERDLHMRKERTFQLASAAFSLLGAALLIMAFVTPANGILSLVATLCFLAALAFCSAAYRKIIGAGKSPS